VRSVLLLLLAGCVCSSANATLEGEVCGNGVDDDGDMFADCSDDECFKACTSECADRCAAADGNRCSDDGFPAQCVRQLNGCADFLRLAGCPHEQLCNSGACVDAGSCVNACIAGGTRCTLAGLEERCVNGPAGCTEWSVPHACANGSRCPLGGQACAGGAAGGAAGGGTAGGSTAGGAAAGGATAGGATAGGAAAGGVATAGGAMAGGTSSGQPCASYFDCTSPGEVCDIDLGRCVPCGLGVGSPCCVNLQELKFVCPSGQVCGNHPGNRHLCCTNQGNGCCSQGGCIGGTCCKCPRNGLNACVQPSFGCGGC